MAERYVNYKITPKNIPNNGILFVDNEKKHRSGHLSHALVEFGKGCIMAFYSNCSPTRNKNIPGHNGFGWLEYRRSYDGGRTWDEPRVFPYSWDSFINQPFTVSCEKAVSTKENEIVAFCLRNENPNGWDPFLEPVVVRSEDGGETWSDPIPFCDRKGRIYDAHVWNGKIFVLMLANAEWLAKSPDHGYCIYVSEDGGRTFSLWSEIPDNTDGHTYGTMTLLGGGSLICYEYDVNDEFRLVYHISDDMGKTWRESGKSYFAKRIRNPQIAKVRGGYILHGRSGNVPNDLPVQFVLYTSRDGIVWDEGEYVCALSGTAYYSNNIVLEESGRQRVLIQSSIPYRGGCVNVAHWFLDIE